MRTPMPGFTFLLAALLVGCGVSATDRAPRIGRASPAGTASDATVLLLDSGAIRGSIAGGTYSYLGIPYAAPPVGDLRFRPPAPALPWSGVRDVLAYGSSCQLSEDCLTLNVWRPAGPQADLPVVLFLHPGSHTMGSGQSSLYGVVGAPYFNQFDGRYLAEHGPMIVVTINYRYGMFGYAAHPALTAEDPHHSSGNYGALDQLAALGWVQRNAAALGADASRVTLFGQSVGAMDICTHLASPLSRGLFSKAILSSEPGCTRPTLAYQEALVGAKLEAGAGCTGAADVAACLRSKPASVIRAAFVKPFHPTWRLGPNVDGYLLQDQPGRVIAAGEGARVPVLLGGTLDEYDPLVDLLLPQPGAGPLATDADYQRHIRKWFAPHGSAVADAILARFPSATYGTPRQTFVRVMSDAFFNSIQRRLERDLREGGNHDVHRYLTSHALEGPPLNALPAAHGVDLPFIFGNLVLRGPGGAYAPTPDEFALLGKVSPYFQRFVSTGDPNVHGCDGDECDAVKWKRAGEDDRYLLIGATDVTTGTGWRADETDFWEATVPQPYVYGTAAAPDETSPGDAAEAEPAEDALATGGGELR